MTRQQARRLLQIMPFVAVMALVVSGMGIYIAFHKADFAYRGEILWGEVVGLEGADQRPTVVFSHLPARETRFVNDVPVDVAVGDKVPVQFLPEDPGTAQIMAPVNWTVPVLLLLFGPIFLILAIQRISKAGRRLAQADGFDNAEAESEAPDDRRGEP